MATVGVKGLTTQLLSTLYIQLTQYAHIILIIYCQCSQSLAMSVSNTGVV